MGKGVIKLVFAMMFIFAMSCKTGAQPTIKTSYTNEQIREMLVVHKTQHSKDVFVDATFSRKFASDFQNAKDVEWDRTEHVYEVDFELGWTNYEAYYDTNAVLIAYKVEASKRSLPDAVKKMIDTTYRNNKIDDVEKLTIGSEVVYKVEIKSSAAGAGDVFIREDGHVYDDFYF